LGLPPGPSHTYSLADFDRPPTQIYEHLIAGDLSGLRRFSNLLIVKVETKKLAVCEHQRQHGSTTYGRLQFLGPEPWPECRSPVDPPRRGSDLGFYELSSLSTVVLFPFTYAREPSDDVVTGAATKSTTYLASAAYAQCSENKSAAVGMNAEKISGHFRTRRGARSCVAV